MGHNTTLGRPRTVTCAFLSRAGARARVRVCRRCDSDPPTDVSDPHPPPPGHQCRSRECRPIYRRVSKLTGPPNAAAGDQSRIRLRRRRLYNNNNICNMAYNGRRRRTGLARACTTPAVVYTRVFVVVFLKTISFLIFHSKLYYSLIYYMEFKTSAGFITMTCGWEGGSGTMRRAAEKPS